MRTNMSPVTQLEFFQLYAIFNNAQETDLTAPQLHKQTAHAHAIRGKWRRDLSRLTAQLKWGSESSQAGL